jgi:hypothetical protein
MRIDIDRLLSEGWKFFDLGQNKVLGPPGDSALFTQAACLETATYKGKTIRFFKYSDFPWEDYIRQDKK